MPAAKTSGRKKQTNSSRKEKVAELLAKIEAQLTDNIKKATVGDFIRLAQFERELEEAHPPGEIIITWMDPTETKDIAESDTRRYRPN